jgi:hypothetical protein
MKQPVEEAAQWRAPVLILLLFFITALVIEGRELVIFTRAFTNVRASWMPVRALVEQSVIATSERRSGSTRSSAVAHVTLFIAGAKVRYALNGETHEVDALGWGERLRILSQWETGGVEAGRTISIRVQPDSPDHATLLGEWTPASSVVFGRFVGTEIAMLCGIAVCGKFVIRRSLGEAVSPK